MTRIAAAPTTTGSSAMTTATSNDDDYFMVDELALAHLVGDMEFDTEQAQEALRVTNNNIERAIDYLLQLLPR